MSATGTSPSPVSDGCTGKASKFCPAFPITDEEAFWRMEAIAREHHTSRHVLRVSSMRMDNAIARTMRANRRGPPESRCYDSFKRLLTYAAVVVRYWWHCPRRAGACLRGSCARSLGEQHEYRTRAATRAFLQCTYAQVEEARNEVRKVGGEVRDASYGEPCELRVALPLSLIEQSFEKWMRMGIIVKNDQVK